MISFSMFDINRDLLLFARVMSILFLFIVQPIKANNNLACDFFESSSILPSLLDEPYHSLIKKYALNGEGRIDKSSSKTLFYSGMSDRGKNYYAFDVSNKDTVKLLFSVVGGKGDYQNLAQTWSRPVISKIELDTEIKKVMFVGGGYDNELREKELRSPDSIGNSIYMIDAENGALLWSASNRNAHFIVAEMQYSVPAQLSIVDRNNDGLADHIYAVDMGGQVLRFDIQHGQSANNLVKGGVLARLSTNEKFHNRRFFFAPDITEVINESEHYYAIALGSGLITKPISKDTLNRFYVIKDVGVFSENEHAFPSTPFMEKDLYDASEHLANSTILSEQKVAMSTLASKKGWYIRLPLMGEKVSSSPTIYNYKVIFTSYAPRENSDTCDVMSGTTRFYLLDLLTGNAISDFDKNNRINEQDRFVHLSNKELGELNVIGVVNTAKPSLCVGPQCAAIKEEYDVDDKPIACSTDFSCLTLKLFDDFSRIQKGMWSSEIEKHEAN